MEDLQMAILSEICNRSDDMRLHMRKYIESVKSDLNDWQRDLFSICYKETMMKRRKAIKVLQHTFTVSPEDEHLTVQYENTIFNEMLEIQEEVVDLIEKKLEVLCADMMGKAFYTKMKADYYRYIAEVARGDIRPTYATKSKELYLKAMDLVKGDEMTVLHVGLTLNYSVFLYEVMFDVKSACKMAEQALKTAVTCCKDSNDEKAKDYLQELISLLTDNVNIWSQKKEITNNDIM